MKFRYMVIIAALISACCTSVQASNPFNTSNVSLSVRSDGTAINSLATTPQSSDELKKALELLSRTKAKFAELLRQIAANPAKFAKNGSMREISQKIASMQNRLNESAKKLLKIYDSTPAGSRPTLPAGSRTPVSVPKTTITATTTPTAATNAPAAKVMNVSGRITSKSPGFKSWMANGVKIAQSWKFPDITNMYGEKISREHFLKAIMYIESGGVHQRSNGSITTSSCGALGFMQLMPRTAQGLGVNPRDPAQNIAGGAKYFNTVFNSGKVGGKTGLDKLVMAACAYNCGPYSKRLDQSWSSFVKDSKAPKESRRYGLKLKMCLGLRLTSEEEMVAKQFKLSGSKSLDQYARDCYSYSKGIGN